MERSVPVACVQMSSQADREANLARVRERVAEAAQAGAKLVLLPENFAYFGEEDDKRAFAEDLDRGDGPIATTLAGLFCVIYQELESGQWRLAAVYD